MADVENMVMGSDDNKNNEQPSIMVPLDDMDSVSADSPHTVDELAQELATIRQSAKKIAIIGSRNLPITHQQMIETLATALVRQHHHHFRRFFRNKRRCYQRCNEG